jgi:PAS domain S-box-containing protein
MKIDRYQELFERSADANLIIVDERFVDCNLATVKMLGYKDKQELLKTHPSQLSPERQQDGQPSYIKANEMMAIAFEKGSHRFEWDHMRANGEVFPVEVLLTYIPEDNERTLHVVWRDITERKQADTALRESRDQLDAIFNSTKDGILVADLQSKKIWTGNKAICEMLGYTIEEITKLTFEDIYPEKKLPQVFNKFEKQAKHEIDLAADILVMRKNATVFFVDIGTSLVTIGGKECMIGIFRDVTERREIEEQKRHRQKLEAIGTLAGGIAHDFNNILAAILGYSELTISELPPNSKLHKNLFEIIRAGKRAAELVKQILTFSQRSKSNFSPQRIQPIIREVLTLLRATIPTSIELRQEIDNDCAFVLADGTQIHQVLMNLCTNAFQSMEETGGTITVKLQEVHLSKNDCTDIKDFTPGKYLYLEVSDNGPGIEKDTLQHIFDPYFTTKQQGKGSGLGLSVVYGIIKDHGGSIRVESNIDHGSTFKVILPVIDGYENESCVDAAKQNQFPVGNERILFIDDEEAIAMLGQTILETLGYIVRYETDSVAALAAFRENPHSFDLVITDQTMPNLTGSELSKELMKIRPDIPIILCTGYSSTISEHKAMNLGIKAYIMKPTDRHTIADTVRKVLDQKNDCRG